MKYKTSFPFALTLLSLLLSGCGATSSSASVETKESEETTIEESSVEPDNKVSVFVLSGQSNMEGSTYFDNGQSWLRKACETLDLNPEPMFDGMEEVQTSFYGFYPYQGWGQDAWLRITPHCSNPEDPLAGKFNPTKVGMGNRDDFMGPEIGLAYKLRENRKDEKPIFLIKCAFSGAGFENGQTPTFKSRSQGVEGQLYDRLVTYTRNNLRLIEDQGYEPVIKALLWHQGESDANRADQTSKYQHNLGTLVSDFREDFAEYAREGRRENIDFIDALVYDGTRLTYGAIDSLNDAKIALSEESEHNFCINTSCKREGGLALEIGGKPGDTEGCCDNYHYITKDCVRLGLAYADVILDNHMLD